jgi:hypothetical protein
MIAAFLDVASAARPVLWSPLRRPNMEAFIAYILTAMLAWCPPQTYYVPYGESVDDATARLKSIAEDIALVAMDAAEPPVFAGQTGRLKTALLEAAVGSMESSYQRFVGEGLCNKPGYRADRRGDCDGGRAFTYWQMWVFNGGYILLGDGTLSAPRWLPQLAQSRPEIVIRGPELLSDRPTAVRVAQRIMRKSMRESGSLCAYSGEPCEGLHPKADVRLDRAQAYWRRHPFEGTIPEPVVATAKYVASNP